MSYKKYNKFKKIEMKNRSWPDNEITKAPIWCSVDLRDGNQALPIPMNVDEKKRLFNLLVKIGFKEIEVGFPSASQTEFDFLRSLVEENLIPEDVSIQVLTQAREHLVRRTFEALEGVKKAIVHIYNSTSTLQRKVVFNKDKEAIKLIAVEGVKLVKKIVEENGDNGQVVTLEYSPESFTGTELSYALEVSNAVMDVWKPSETRRAILNLPSTVEMSTPNVYADQIEWMSSKIKNREYIEISLHAHNDRGTGVAATELGILAGADRVEGTLFGNGERTGNTDILNVAMNLYSQGIDPKLDLLDIDEISKIYEEVTKLPIHPRHPYVGELVFTAFSGSHQDAINKGLKYLKDNNLQDVWEVPYLPIDPSDLGRKYEAIIRINSQSGKGGVAFVMAKEYGLQMPKEMHPDFGRIVQRLSESSGNELSKEEIYNLFKKSYIDVLGPLKLHSYKITETIINKNEDLVKLIGKITLNGKEFKVSGEGNGPLSAYINSIEKLLNCNIIIVSYNQHAKEHATNAESISYISIKIGPESKTFYGVGISPNITSASIEALNSAVNRSLLDNEYK